MNSPPNSLAREQGFALITALLVLLVLTVLGILATNNATIELRIAGNDRVHKQTFYQADGGTELNERLLYENVICSEAKSGFSHVGAGEPLRGRIVVLTKDFASQAGTDVPEVSDATAQVVYYPSGTIAASTPHTNFNSRYTQAENEGYDNSMSTGYVRGGTPPGANLIRTYASATQHVGLSESKTTLVTKWRIQGSKFSSLALQDCKY